LYDSGVTAPIGSTQARDVQIAAATWRPQRFTESGGDVQDPLIEPLWTGLRVLAVVDGDRVTFRDIDGDATRSSTTWRRARCRPARRSLILDGYLTHQVLQEPGAIARTGRRKPRAASSRR
jgi:hypothetical protein